MQELTAHLFPAFTLKYTGKEIDILKKHDVKLNERIFTAEQISDIKISDFNIKTNNYIDDELKNQILSYLFACAFSDIVKKHFPAPAFVSGFSMGLYAALYHTNSLSFENGLILIKNIYDKIKNIYSETEQAMASVVGFEENELKKYIEDFKDIEIVIKNGIYSFIISGEKKEINKLLRLLKSEGAIHIALLNVRNSYHTKKLQKHEGMFSEIVKKISINNADTPLISMISQNTFFTKEDTAKEIVRNITQNLNFFETVKVLNKLKIKTFIETGAGTSLLKSSKFIDGDFRFFSVAKGKLFIKQ